MDGFQRIKIIQEMTLNTHKRCFIGKMTKKHLKFRKMTPFCITVILYEKLLKNTVLRIREMTSF